MLNVTFGIPNEITISFKNRYNDYKKVYSMIDFAAIKLREKYHILYFLFDPTAKEGPFGFSLGIIFFTGNNSPSPLFLILSHWLLVSSAYVQFKVLRWGIWQNVNNSSGNVTNKGKEKKSNHYYLLSHYIYFFVALSYCLPHVSVFLSPIFSLTILTKTIIFFHTQQQQLTTKQNVNQKIKKLFPESQIGISKKRIK